jgi:sec-independent protein translocase protein TatA
LPIVSSRFRRCPAGRLPAFAARYQTLSFLRESEAMFGIGHWEVLLIVLVIFILFGHRLPSVMRSLGRGVVEFKEGMAGVNKDDEHDEKKDA